LLYVAIGIRVFIVLLRLLPRGSLSADWRPAEYQEKQENSKPTQAGHLSDLEAALKGNYRLALFRS
jgi:hypothetical protein